jgi:hypothetical protein
MDFTGTVSGVDVIATPGLPVRCLAFVSRDAQNEIQVVTELQQLQTALELASHLRLPNGKKVPVEVSFVEQGGEKKLTRVHILDR